MVALKDDYSVIGAIHQKELFNKSSKDSTIIKMMQDKTLKNEHKFFFSELTKTLNNLQEIVDNS